MDGDLCMSDVFYCDALEVMFVCDAGKEYPFMQAGNS